MAAKGFDLSNTILLLVYVALALTVVWLRPLISDYTGLSQGAVLAIAVVVFLAIALGSALMRRKKA